MIGQVSDENRRLVEETKECLNRGIAAAQAWHFVGDIGAAVQSYAESCGYSVVRELGGHGVGISSTTIRLFLVSVRKTPGCFWCRGW